jgi:hypothetical protein
LQAKGRLNTGNRLAVKRLDVVFRDRQVFDQLGKAVQPLGWLPIPQQGRRLSIKLGEICEASIRVIGGIVEPSEMIGGSGGNFYAVKC